MKKLMILLTIAALACMTFTALADGDGIAFDTSVSAISEGETLQTVLTREGAAAEGEVTYTSSNPKMATVDESGLVTAVLKGKVVITATVKTEKTSYKAQLKLDIIRPVTTVKVSEAKLEIHAADEEKIAQLLTRREDEEENALPILLLPMKKKITVTATVEPKDASNRNVTFTSSDEGVFTAAKGGLNGVAPGEGILTVASESNPEVNVRYRVLVVQPVTKIAVEASDPQVIVGGTATVSATVQPDNATIKSVQWSSGDEKILTIDASGLVTGIKRGNGRIIATANDGSNIRANFSLKVVQNPESITLSTKETTIDVGKVATVKATVEPTNTDDKKVSWASSDESIATVDKNGRIKGIAVGDCTVTCTSQALDSVSESLTVHIQQPVKKLSFRDKNAYAYVKEETKLKWTIEPKDATNKKLEFKSAKESIATVDENGIVTGVSSGKVKITATTTDGSKRSASIIVEVGKHVTGVEMIRNHAYIDVGEVATAGANIEPNDALNHNMSWESSDTGIVKTEGNTNHKMKLTGVAKGEATIYGTTEDGGFETSLMVTVGDYDHGLSFDGFDFEKSGRVWLNVTNKLKKLNITQITATLELWDCSGEEIVPAVINTKNGSNKVEMIWSGTLTHGKRTGKDGWRMVNYMKPDCGMYNTRGQITITSYQIDNDWIKCIRKKNQPFRYWD